MNFPKTQPDAIQAATYEYRSDPRKNKVALHIGVVKDAKGHDVALDSIKMAAELAEKKLGIRNNYITAADTKPYQEGVKRFIFNNNREIIQRTGIIDAYGGTNALFLLEFFAIKYFPQRLFIVAEDGWPNHPNQIAFAFDKKLQFYRIADSELNYLHEPYQKLICSHKKSSLIAIEQNSPHNSLGIVLSKKDWDKRLTLLKKHDAIILFDCPYAGLGRSLDEDLYPIRKAAEMGIFALVAFSESKLKAAYDQRIGAALIVSPDPKMTANIQGVLNKIERAVQSFTTKSHLTFVELYENPRLYRLWQKEFKEKIRGRIDHCRELGLKYITHPQTREILKKSRGLFSTFPMSHKKAQELWEEDGIMLVKPEKPSPTFDNKAIVRINITGVGDEKSAKMIFQKIDKKLTAK